MQRRKFITRSALGATTAASLAAPALAQGQHPEIRWRLASSYPKTLDTIYGAVDLAVKRVAELTDGRFRISLHGAGELVPPLQVLDAVMDGTVEAGHSASYFYIGRDPAFGFGTAMPFGLNTRGQNAWLYEGGGNDVLNEFYAGFGLYHLPIGNTGAQMAGWYRKEIKTVDDLKGLKFRIGGLGGMVLSKLGVVPQQLAAGDLYPSLEKGVIDAAEFVGPYDDEKLGLHKVAKFYYYPGWWEGSATLPLFINQKAWAALPAAYQAAVKAASAEANQWSTAKYDIGNPAALKRLVSGGAQLRAFPKPVMDASFTAAGQLYQELAEKSPAFRKIHAHWSKFRDEQLLWQQFCEQPFDTYMASTRRRS
ncbi:TRAP transporter substrate-binding protein [Aquincola sp. J276]|uniref:TRAP transporter substrate-binding protein n=1 Tax=Aquincola sp. J276 TaxID=2898432 RepID=UPI002150BCC3|nr:TRAP transporter substrate-binding protein DctP [Aquincola sp. J276]MCR5864413.1 TRAP transporter substrate-binding protein DctP [Aquincola sp. J276]